MIVVYISPDADDRPSPGTADAGRWRTDAGSHHGIITMNEVVLYHRTSLPLVM